MTGHPAVDIHTDRAAVIVQDRPLIPMSAWLADAMVACDEAGVAVQILSPDTARVTLPLLTVLDLLPGSHWVIQEPVGDGYYDGLTGAPLTWDGAAFTPTGDAAPARSETFLLDGPSAADDHELIVDLSVLRRADEGLEIGATAESLSRALAGAAPRSWDICEPALLPWDRAEITGLCRDRVPDPTWLIFAGPPGGRLFVGTERVSLVPAGVQETITLVAAYRNEETPPLDALAELADALATEMSLLTMTVQWATGRADLTYTAHRRDVPVPLAIAIGPRDVAEVDVDPALTSLAAQTPIGSASAPGAWYSFTGTPHQPNAATPV